MSITETTRAAAEIYFAAWQDRDFDRLRSVLAPDVTFVGALGTANGIDECIAGLRGMAESVMARIDVKTRVADGEDVITWFDLVTRQGPALPTANWSHVEGGLITAIRVAFDPRPLTDA